MEANASAPPKALAYDASSDLSEEEPGADIRKYMREAREQAEKGDFGEPAFVIQRIKLGADHAPTGKTRHYGGGALLPAPRELRIVKYPDAPGYHLVYIHSDERDLSHNTWHDTLKRAMSQADFEFRVRPDQWEKIVDAVDIFVGLENGRVEAVPATRNADGTFTMLADQSLGHVVKRGNVVQAQVLDDALYFLWLVGPGSDGGVNSVI